MVHRNNWCLGVGIKQLEKYLLLWCILWLFWHFYKTFPDQYYCCNWDLDFRRDGDVILGMWLPWAEVIAVLKLIWWRDRKLLDRRFLDQPYRPVNPHRRSLNPVIVPAKVKICSKHQKKGEENSPKEDTHISFCYSSWQNDKREAFSVIGFPKIPL